MFCIFKVTNIFGKKSSLTHCFIRIQLINKNIKGKVYGIFSFKSMLHRRPHQGTPSLKQSNIYIRRSGPRSSKWRPSLLQLLSVVSSAFLFWPRMTLGWSPSGWIWTKSSALVMLKRFFSIFHWWSLSMLILRPLAEIWSASSLLSRSSRRNLTFFISCSL